MEIIYTTEQNRKLFLYTYENQLYLRAMQHERVARPLLLCNNYERGLSSTLYNQTLYYTYLNQDHSLLVRSLTESSALFRLDGTDTVSYDVPYLVVFAGQLLLFYIENKQNSYFLRSHALFAEAQPEPLWDCFSELPEFLVLSSGQYLFILLYTDTSSKLLRYDTEFCAKPLVTREELSYEFTPILEQQRKLLHDKEQEVSDTKLLLERAKTQYAELMDVAAQYRDEAIKWRSKFIKQR